MKPSQDSEIIRSGFEEMTKLEIVIAPWLAMSDERLNEEQHKRIHDMARELSVMYNTGQMLWWDTIAIPDFYREHVYRETLLSTAAYLSYMRLGTLVITDEMVSVAYLLIKEFVRRDGGAVLLSVYARTMTYLNGQLLLHYGKVPEAVFVSGEWHRPWIERPLEEELAFGLEHSLFERETENGQNYIKLTARGEELVQACERDLESCGYLRQREQLTRASNLTNLDDYDVIMDEANPKIHEMRRKLVDWSNIQPGMKVLELGCGAGALTLEDGLAERVGNEGSVIATDPSVGMLSRATKKNKRYGYSNVVFQQATAEQLPYADDTFDAVIGMMFLHFTDIPRAFKEIRRVTKNGGTFTALYSLNFSLDAEFFLEWFAPVLGKTGMGNSLPTAEVVPTLAPQYFETFECEPIDIVYNSSNIEAAVKWLSGAMPEIYSLPWRARETVIQDLYDRGYAVKKVYGADGMKFVHPSQWFHGVVKK